MNLMKNFEFEDYRVGDVVKFHYLNSLSEGKGNLITGIIIKTKKNNSYNGRIKVLARVAGERVLFDLLK